MNIILLGSCVIVACFGIFTALLGSGKPKLFGAIFSILLGSSLAMAVCSFLGVGITSIPAAISMGAASLVLLILSVWKEAAALLIISICGGFYIGSGLVYGVMTLFSMQFDFMIAGLIAAIIALIFAAICLVRPSNGILVATSFSGGGLVSISGSIILYMVLNIAASSGVVGDLLAIYNALSPNTILLIWLFGLLLGGGAMLLQSVLMKAVEDVDDDSWENWQPEYEEEIEEPIVVKRGPRRKKKRKLVEPYDWGEAEDTNAPDDLFEEEDWAESTSAQVDEFDNESELDGEDSSEQDAYELNESEESHHKESIRTVIPPMETPEDTNGSTKVFRKVVLPEQSEIPSYTEHKTSADEQEPAKQAESHEHASRLTRPTFPPRSQRRK